MDSTANSPPTSGTEGGPSSDAVIKERLVRAIRDAMSEVESGAFPLRLDAFFLCIMDRKTGRSNLLPVVRGGARTSRQESPNIEKTEEYRLYEKCFVDDSDGCMETNDEFLSMKKTHPTPSDAMPDFVSQLAKSGKIPAGQEERLGKMWSRWLGPTSWSSLNGTFVNAHEVPTIAERCLPTADGLLHIPRYSFYYPEYEDFLDTLGFDKEETDKKMPGYCDAFIGAFVQVWRAGGNAEGKGDSEDIEAVVDRAWEKSLERTAISDSSKTQLESEEEGDEERDQPTQCSICGFVRRPYQPPEYVKSCYNCKFAYCFSCKDKGMIAITPCCEEYCSECPASNREEPYLLRCDNCSDIWCVALCCNKNCMGAVSCEDEYSNCKESKINGGNVWPHIYHCKECGQNTCQECANADLCMEGCDGHNDH